MKQLLILALTTAVTCVSGQAQKRSLGAIDVARVRELYRLTDVLGDKLWPGFDTRKTPIAINNDDREELLAGHPRPPKEFSVFKNHQLGNEPVMIRDGCTRYGPRSGGWAVNLGGEQTAYVGTLKQGTTENYLSLLIHECFHVYQRTYRERADGPRREPPDDDPTYAALIGLESRILHAALQEPIDKKARLLAQMFTAVRHERRRGLAVEVVRTEGEQEYSEGTATYIQARMFQLLAATGGIKPVTKKADHRYGGFATAGKSFREFVRRVLPAKGLPISFFHAQYQNGMAQGLLLDRLRPGWKEEMREKGMTQFKLLERELPLRPKAEATLVARAKRRFAYGELLAEQKHLVDERLATIRGFLTAEGRRYRVYHGNVEGRFKWKPKGPVYRVPPSLLSEAGKRVELPGRGGGTAVIVDPHITVWAGGIRRFEKGDLVFESGSVPVIFRADYLEWIDTDPATDSSDLVIESKRVAGDIHQGLRVKTDGFVLRVGRARIEKSDKVVAIYPLPEE